MKDVVIAGGGLAGLCLAIQLKRAVSDLAVTVVERRAGPLPDAAWKVGESSVEIASLYFERTVGVRDLLEQHVPKFGLRFFLPHGDNRDLTRRLECGPSRFFTVPSYQLDRGLFENQLRERAVELGVDLIEGVRVSDIALGEEGAAHRITLGDGRVLEARWIVDASGRAGLIKRKLKLAKGNRHAVNAAWFRLEREIDIDQWHTDPSWRGRVEESRRLSTNHLMGRGYWAWIIPLAEGRTSIGIVADAVIHPFDTIRTEDAALAWLERYEPELFAMVRDEPRMDFLVMKDYSHGCRRTFDADARWALTGEAGYFTDPLYSPGSDFIGLANELIGDLILRDRVGEAISDRAKGHERTYASFYRAVLSIYEHQYSIMGSPRGMTLKVLWDFTMYWSGLALVYSQGVVTDEVVLSRIRGQLMELGELGLSMQRFLRELGERDQTPISGFVNYSEVPFLARLNADILHAPDLEWFVGTLESNVGLVREIDTEIRARVARLEGSDAPVVTQHLRHVFEQLVEPIEITEITSLAALVG